MHSRLDVDSGNVDHFSIVQAANKELTTQLTNPRGVRSLGLVSGFGPFIAGKTLRSWSEFKKGRQSWCGVWRTGLMRSG